MAYSRKFAGLFGSLGYNHTVDCTTESADAILGKVLDAFANRAGLKRDLDQSFALGLEKLDRYEAALRQLFVTLGKR